MPEINYRFYATLLDSFQYYLGKADDDNAFQEFIDRLNCKPFFSEAAMKGTAFNELIDEILSGKFSLVNAETDSRGNISYPYSEGEVSKTFKFKKNVVTEIARRVYGSIPQKYTEAVLPTRYGNVLVYGYADEVLKNKVIDIKTTGSYVFPKYLNSWQRRVYPYCLRKEGIYVDSFQYLITDFSNVYIEDYPHMPELDVLEMQRFSEQLIDYIETHRPLILSPKLFNAEAHQSLP